MAFHADVVSWVDCLHFVSKVTCVVFMVVVQDLPKPAERGVIRHHVKVCCLLHPIGVHTVETHANLQEASGYGIDEWSLTLTIQLSEKEFAAHLRESQRKKGQRADEDPEDAELASLESALSWKSVAGLDEGGMWPAKKKNYVAGTRLVSHFILSKVLADLDDREWTSLQNLTRIYQNMSIRCS